MCAASWEDYSWLSSSCEERKGFAVEINIIFKIALVGILVSMLNQILRQTGREEQAFLTSLAGLILVLFWVIPYIAELFETIERLFAI